MRMQIFTIAILIGLLAWGGLFFVTRGVYREAQQSGVIPNLHLKDKLGITSMAISL
ncbi:hypothetical protein [Pararhizobium sp. A13]|uniref:hypothetical protein n=1 Tax=Pararhizobium sp. A13 TaxID=3133975 RepID=UPI0032501D93